MSRFETEVLTQDGSVEGLGRVNAKWVDGAMSRTAHRRVILDMDSSESPVHGEQEGASYNGHFGSTCYHPLFVFNQFGDCEGAMLRAGNVHSAHRWRDVLDPILSRYGATGVRRYFRADAAFAKPDIYEYIEARHVLIRYKTPRQRGAATGDRPSAQEAGGEAAEASSDPIRRFLVSCRELGPRSARGGEGGVAQGRAVPSGGLHRHEHDGWPRRSGAILQWSRDSRAVDQGGEVRAELDSAVVPSVRGQPGASVSVRPGVQPWELPSPAVSAQGGQALVPAERAGQADQDGRPSGAALPAIDLSAVRGVGSSTVVPGSVGSYRPVIAGAKLREGTTTILPRGGERSRESACLQYAFTPLAGDTRTMKTDKKGALRLQTHLLSDRLAIDWPCRT